MLSTSTPERGKFIFNRYPRGGSVYIERVGKLPFIYLNFDYFRWHFGFQVFDKKSFNLSLGPVLLDLDFYTFDD